MKKIFLIYLFSVVSIFSMKAAEDAFIQMPSQEVLEALFIKAGFDELVDRSDIVTRLADDERLPAGLVTAIDFACYDYVKNNITPQMHRIVIRTLKKNQRLFYKLLLEKEYPLQLAEVEKILNERE